MKQEEARAPRGWSSAGDRDPGAQHDKTIDIKKKSLVETRDTLAAARRDTSSLLPTAYRPSVAERWCQSCVHYNSLGWGIEIESLGFSVVLNPMSASLSTSLRADYGGALDICVAIFGRADQHSAGAEGAPYRLSIGGFGVCVLLFVGGKNADIFSYVP
eukprot:scaffold6968_cov117-Isochrysis_galbana.AAC.6